MRSSRLVACGSIVLAAAALMACVASGDDVQPGPGHPEEDTSPPDGDATAPLLDAASEPDASIEGPRCSEAGWCTTTLPDVDLLMKDIWAFPGRAVVVAESPTLGVKILEWTDIDARWTYIDDGTPGRAHLKPRKSC